jgi:hypothetical protein
MNLPGLVEYITVGYINIFNLSELYVIRLKFPYHRLRRFTQIEFLMSY